MKLIDKDAVLAEIEKKMAESFGNTTDFATAKKMVLTELKSAINSLEVTEVAKITQHDIKIYINNKAQKKENSYENRY